LNYQLKTGYDRTELALMSQKAEHEFALCKCGIMDQFAAAQERKIMLFS
jgi:galactokinase